MRMIVTDANPVRGANFQNLSDTPLSHAEGGAF